MAVTCPQKNNPAQVFGTSINPSLGGVTAGSTLVLAVAGGSGTTTFSVSDSAGATFTSRKKVQNGSHTLEVFTAPNVSAGTHSVTVTVQAGGSQGLACVLWEAAGADTSAPFDNAQSGTGTDSVNNTITTSAAVTVSGAGEMIFAATTDDDGASNYTAGSGYTLDANQSGASNQGFGAEHKAVSASESPTITTGETTGAAWSMVAVSIKPPAAGGGAVSHLLASVGVGG